jgi:hypothetical protein
VIALFFWGITVKARVSGLISFRMMIRKGMLLVLLSVVDADENLATHCHGANVADFLNLSQTAVAIPLVSARFAPAVQPLLAGLTGLMGAKAFGTPINTCLIPFNECAFCLVTFLTFHQLLHLWFVDYR